MFIAIIILQDCLSFFTSVPEWLKNYGTFAGFFLCVKNNLCRVQKLELSVYQWIDIHF